jgi:DNA mismatch repair ATPase MutS
MTMQIDKDKFSYKLTQGCATSSFASKVARLAGLPEKVMEIAERK